MSDELEIISEEKNNDHPYILAGHLDTVSTNDLEKITLIIQAYNQQRNDLKLIKDVIYKMMKTLGMMNPDGTFRENISVKSIMDIMMRATMDRKKFTKDMSFLSDLIPLIEKYQNL